MNRKPNILFFFSDQHRGDWMPYDEESNGFRALPIWNCMCPTSGQ